MRTCTYCKKPLKAGQLCGCETRKADPNTIRYYECSHIGVSGTTGIAIRKTPEGFEARMGFALMGQTNMNEEEFRACDYNPFHEEFHDNYVKGTGATEEEAMAAMKNDLHDISESLWV